MGHGVCRACLGGPVALPPPQLSHLPPSSNLWALSQPQPHTEEPLEAAVTGGR